MLKTANHSRAFHMPGSTVELLSGLAHSNLTTVTTLGGSDKSYPHFPGKKTGKERLSNVLKEPTADTEFEPCWQKPWP